MNGAFVAAGVAVGLGIGVLWIWRFWALRTWRTLAVFVIAGLLVAIALISSSNGILIALPIAGIGLWLVASGNQFLLSMPREDLRYADLFREADERARRILTTLGNAEPQAIAALDDVINSLSVTPPHPDWEPARAAKVEELSLARVILAGTDTTRNAADRLRSRRADARRLFLDARRSRSAFWGMPQ